MPPKALYSSQTSLQEMVTQLNNKRQSASSRWMADGIFDDDDDVDYGNENNNSINEWENKFWMDSRRCAHECVCVCRWRIGARYVSISMLVTSIRLNMF